MISKNFQVVLVIITLINLIINVYYIRKMEMRVKYALIWLTLSVLLIILAIFPSILMSVASLLHISSDTNTLFMLAIGFLYIISFSFSIMFSRNSRRITKLIQQIALMNKHIEELQKQVDKSYDNKVN